MAPTTTMDDMLSLLHDHAMWILVACTIVWKQRMTKGGSSLARQLKGHALKRKRRRRKRLKDFLADDLLRKQMVKEVEAKMGKEEADRHMEELDLMASRDVTADDVQISTKEVTGEATRRVCWLYGAIAIGVRVAFRENNALVQLSVALIFHIFDNRLNLSKRKAKWVSWMWLAIWIAVQISVAMFALFDDAAPSFLLLGFVLIAGLAASDSGSSGKSGNKKSNTEPSRGAQILDV